MRNPDDWVVSAVDKVGILLTSLFILLGLAWMGFVVWVLYTVVEWLVTK